MKTTIVCNLEPITLLGGGTPSKGDIDTALRLAPTCVAADGGAHLALGAGIDLAAVIGDMDSISPKALAQIPQDRRHVVHDQMTTDFDKALAHFVAPAIVAVGFSGGRVDHQLAVYHTLAAHPDKACIVLAEEDVVFLCPPEIALDAEDGTRVSLFPLAPVQGTSTGLVWPIEGLNFGPTTFIGTSNRATGPFKLRLEAPDMLCILPREMLDQVVEVLVRMPQHARWPARV